MATKKIYLKIRDQLAHDIQTQVYLPGHYMPSEQELARRFNVSRPTVRRALDELLRENVVAKKPGVGTLVLGKAATSSPKPMRVVAVNMAKWRGPLGDSIRQGIMNGILSALHEHGIRLAFMPEEDMLHKRMEDVDGIIWIKDGANNYAFTQALAAKRLPVVIANRWVEQSDWNCVSSDNRQGMFLGVEYLIGLGHRRIALIGGADDEWLHKTRFRGYTDALEAYGMPMDPDLMFCDTYESSSVEKVREFISSRRVSAVVAFGGSKAPTVIQAAAPLLRIPDQLSLVCFDDVDEWFIGGAPPITCIRQPLVEMGRAAVELLLDHAHGVTKQRQQLPCELIVRRSCRQWTSGSEMGEANRRGRERHAIR